MAHRDRDHTPMPALPDPAELALPCVRLVGTIDAPAAEIVLARATLKAEGAARLECIRCAPFALLLESGERMRVEPDAARRAPLLAADHTRRGQWRELEADPLAAAFRDRAPSPEVSIELCGALVRGGETIEVLGEPCALEPVTASTGPARAPEVRVVAVRPLCIAAGPDQGRLMDKHCQSLPKPAMPAQLSHLRALWWQKWLARAAALGVLGLLLGAAVRTRAVLGDVVALLVMTLVVSHNLLRVDTRTPLFRLGAKPQHPKDLTAAGLLGGVCVAVASVLALARVVYAAVSGAPSQGAVACLVLGVGLASLAIGTYRTTRFPARIARKLLAAAMGEADSVDGAWAVQAGVVTESATDSAVPSSPGARQVKLALALDQGALRVADPFLVQTPQGTVHVHAEQPLWASTVRLTRRESAHRLVSDEAVPMGSRVLIAGRTQQDCAGVREMHSTGPEPIIVFAVDSATDPAVHLQRFAKARALSLSLLSLSALGLVAFGLVSYWLGLR